MKSLKRAFGGSEAMVSEPDRLASVMFIKARSPLPIELLQVMQCIHGICGVSAHSKRGILASKQLQCTFKSGRTDSDRLTFSTEHVTSLVVGLCCNDGMRTLLGVSTLACVF